MSNSKVPQDVQEVSVRQDHITPKFPRLAFMTVMHNVPAMTGSAVATCQVKEWLRQDNVHEH